MVSVRLNHSLCRWVLCVSLLTVSACEAADPVTDLQLRSIPEIPVPGYLESILDPTFGTTITRITGVPGDSIIGANPSLEGVWSDIARHGYSKRSPWNCDQSLLLLGRHKGTPPMLFLDGQTYEPVFGRRASFTEARWHVSRPSHMVFIHHNTLGLWNVRTDAIDTLQVFDGYADLHIGPWEGNLSTDGRMIVLVGTHDQQTVAFAYNLHSKTQHPDLLLPGVDVDWASASASGKYIVVNGDWEGHNDQTQVYDLAGQPMGARWRSYGRPSHYDLTLDGEGEDVAVGVSKSAPDEGRVIMRRLRDGRVTVLTDGGYASHASTRNVGLPGWAFVTYQNLGPTFPPYWNEIVAVALAGGMVKRLAHLHAVRTDYEAESHAVPSPDGRRVLFASNWATPADSAGDGRPVATYVVRLPDH